MTSVNKWIGIGNIGKDPDIRYSANGEAVCSISIACTYSHKDKATGDRKEDTEWVRIMFFGKLAEIAGQYLKKGRQVYIEGRLQTRKWQDKNTGADRYTTEIIASELKMLGGKQSAGGEQERPEQQQAQQKQAAAKPAFDEFEDDIPF